MGRIDRNTRHDENRQKYEILTNEPDLQRIRRRKLGIRRIYLGGGDWKVRS